MPVIRDPAARIASILSQAERRLSKEFLLAIARVRDAASLTTIASLLSQGQIEQAMAFAEGLGTRLSTLSNAEFVRAGESTSVLIGQSLPVGVVVDFDQVNVRAVRQMQDSKLRLIREFSEGQRAATREAVAEGISRGLNPKAQARVFRDSVGLTERQVRAVNRYRTLLEQGSSQALDRELRDRRFDRTVRRSVRDRKPLTKEQVDVMVDRYRERYVAHRARTIARTEALRAVNAGHNEAYEQGIDSGVLSREKTLRTWTPAKDDRVRDSHADMRGQQRKIGEPFITGAGVPIMHPGDPEAPGSETIQCRCTLAVRTEV